MDSIFRKIIRQDLQDCQDFFSWFPEETKKTPSAYGGKIPKKAPMFTNHCFQLKGWLYKNSSPKAIGFGHFHPENGQHKSCLSCKSCLIFFYR